MSRRQPIPGTLQDARLAGLGTVVLITLAVLALSGLRVAGEFEHLFASAKPAYMASRGLDSPALQWALAGYAAALLGVYLAVALVAFGLSRLVQFAFARPDVERRKLAAVCFILCYAWVHAANAAFFQNSLFAQDLHAVLTRPLALGLSIFGWSSVAALAGLLVVAGAALRRAGPGLRRVRAGYPLAAAASALAFAVLLSGHRESPAGGTHSEPNVILIGIDSLRCDLSAFGPAGSLTPEVDRFLAHSHVFSDAMTPLARTFPAWVSVLTGRHPVTTGARINLTARPLIHEGDTLADILRRDGYRTVLATDEVRFSNIDQSYGFDQVIAPPIGATDFVLATFNDFPVANLLSRSRAAAWLFPNTYANRAAYKTYDPSTFVERLDAELDNDGPTMLMVHLTLAHYPYVWDDLEYTTLLKQFKEVYPKAIAAADRQFADTLALLDRKGLLDNAIVVLLSDHGEAVGLPGDSLVPKNSPDPDLRWSSLWGHGTSVLSPHQYRVVLGMRSFGNSLVDPRPATHALPVSLEDVTPTLLELLGRAGGGPFDGRSLAGLLDGNGVAAPDWQDRVRFTESEFNPPALFAGGSFDETKLAMEASYNYVVTPEGRLELREESLRTIIRSKEMAALRGAQKLASVPDGRGGRLYFWFDGITPFPMRLTRPPSPTELPQAAELLAALAARFPGEVPPPASSAGAAHDSAAVRQVPPAGESRPPA
jgi:arylsulfatase A-like enzyme